MQSVPYGDRPNVDVLRDSVGYLQKLLSEKTLTSVDIVTAYLDQIDRHNVQGLGLRCVIFAAPRDLALAEAQKLDQEREQSGARGPMHGIPVLVKVAQRLLPADLDECLHYKGCVLDRSIFGYGYHLRISGTTRCKATKEFSRC